MSEIIRALNLIKLHRDASWLTDSQQQALLDVKEALRIPGTVNLCGPKGVGKTFLAWNLADELNYVYFPHLSYFMQVENLNTSGIVLDNCQPRRQAHREVLKTLRSQGTRHAVLITRQLIQDYTHYVDLGLTEADIDKVQGNLATINLIPKESQVSNYWHLINLCL